MAKGPLTAIGSLAAGTGGSLASLRSYSVGRDGTITGHYSDGVPRTLGQLRLARFANPAGLAARAGKERLDDASLREALEASPAREGDGPSHRKIGFL